MSESGWLCIAPAEPRLPSPESRAPSPEPRLPSAYADSRSTIARQVWAAGLWSVASAAPQSV